MNSSKKRMSVLGIETSCDETSASVLETPCVIKSNCVASQIKTHAKFGGVVPELASRDHIAAIEPVVRRALSQAQTNFKDIGLIAVTTCPGLSGSLLVGCAFAKALGFSLGIPVAEVNHVHSHALSACLSHPELKPPFISLVVSGGHTILFHVTQNHAFKVLGKTHDDAAGEAFDKAAKLLGLPFPGGPSIDKAARLGRRGMWPMPKLMRDEPLNFSFSGLKTSLMYAVKNAGGLNTLSKDDINNICADFEAAVIDNLIEKTVNACEMSGLKTAAAGGGVTLNTLFRQKFQELHERGIKTYLPEPGYCADNAAMIAHTGYSRFSAGILTASSLDITVEPSYCF